MGLKVHSKRERGCIKKIFKLCREKIVRKKSFSLPYLSNVSASPTRPYHPLKIAPRKEKKLLPPCFNLATIIF